MLTNDKVSLNNLISIYSGGLKVATFAQIKQALIEQYRFIYGVDIDVDDTTADGIFINTNALIINNILQTMQSMYSNLDINTASGEYLDILCRLSNIERKPATRSNTNLQVTFIGPTRTTYTPDQLTFVDKSGAEWAPLQDYTFDPDETKIVYVECKKFGPITAPLDWIYQVVDATIPILVSQQEVANIGQEQESDFNLRVRQTSSGSGAGLTTLSALQSQLLSINGIRDVLILNNESDARQTLDDNSALQPHSIYVILRYQEGISIPDAQIGRIIYTKLTPGIGTSTPDNSSLPSGTVHQYEHKMNIANISSSTLSRQIVSWKEVTGIAPMIQIHLTPYSYFSTSEFESIAKYMMDYLNNLSIGVAPTSNDILLKMISADPKFKGSPTYYVTSVLLSAMTNPLDVYNYTTFEYNEEDGSYILILS